ncbi:MAG: CBS domain-containing protein, partial [Nodosilinea sp.]
MSPSQSATLAIDQPLKSLVELAVPTATVAPTATLQQVIEQLGANSISPQSCVMIVDQNVVVGLITERDVIRLLASGTAVERAVINYVNNDLTVLSVESSLIPLDILDIMRQRRIHHLPLVDENQHLQGLITAHSLQQALFPPHVLKLQSVRSRMTPHVVTVHPTDSALKAVTALADYQVSCVAVVDPDSVSPLVGLVLRQDLLRFQARQQDLAELSIQTVMREAQFCLKPDDSLWLAYQAMGQRHLPCLPVVTAQNQPLGIITQSDLLYSLDLRESHSSFGQLWQSFTCSNREQVELWKNHSSELERLVQARTEQLEAQAKCDRLLTFLTQRIHESLDTQDILSTTVSEVRQLLQADRTLIYRFDTPARGTVVVEAVVSPWDSLLGQVIEDNCFANHWADAFRFGRIQAVEDIYRAGLTPCHIELLAQLQIQANLVIPIVYDHKLWGLLVVNQCHAPRRWHDWEIRLVEQLARSVAIGLRQAELYQKLQDDLALKQQYEQHLQRLNDELEQKVEARTASWRRATEQLQDEVDHRRQAEQALEITNQQLQAVLNAVPAMVSWVDSSGHYLGCNHRLANTVNLAPADFAGKPIGFLGQSSPFGNFVTNFLASDVETASQQLVMPLNQTTSHVLVVGQKYDQGDAAVFVGLDISDREQAKAALQTSELKFRSLVEQTNDWVWEIDSQLCFSYINPRATEILDRTPAAILNHRFTDFMPKDEAVRFSTILALLVGQRQPFTQLEATCLRSSGGVVTLEISGSPIFTPEGEFQGYRGITRDITERKQIEVDIRKALTREKELGDLKTRFISMASHEFRTPLTTILASAETLERYSQKFTPEKQQVVLKRIQTSVHHMIGLLNDVLTVGKAEAGKLNCTVAPLDLHQFCRDLVEEVQFAQVSTASPIEFIATGDHFGVLADEKLLRHILLNLLSNAVKYSPKHTPVTFTLDCEADQTVLQVRDRGIGIPPADQAQLFGAFHRADNVGNISGTGL